MALSIDGSQREALAISSVCTQVANMLAKIDAILEHNSDMSIDWGAQVTPQYIAEDPSGNISGLLFDRQSVSNAIGSMVEIRNLLTGGVVNEGDHIGNINKLSVPVPVA